MVTDVYIELNSFQKAVWEAICLKTESPLSSERCVTDHTGISMKGLLGWGPKFCLTTKTFILGTTWSRIELFESQIVQDGRHSRLCQIPKDNYEIALPDIILK